MKQIIKPVKAKDDDEAEQVVKDEEAEVKDEEADPKAEAEAMRAFKLSARGSIRQPYNAVTFFSQSMPEPSSAASSSSQSRPKPSSAPKSSEMTRSARDRAMKKASLNAEGIHKHKTQKGIEQRDRRDERRKYEKLGLEVPAEFAKREATPSRQEQQSKAKNNMGIKFGPFGPPVEYGPRPPAFPPPPAPQTSSSSSAPVQIHTHTMGRMCSRRSRSKGGGMCSRSKCVRHSLLRLPLHHQQPPPALRLCKLTHTMGRMCRRRCRNCGRSSSSKCGRMCSRRCRRECGRMCSSSSRRSSSCRNLLHRTHLLSSRNSSCCRRLHHWLHH